MSQKIIFQTSFPVSGIMCFEGCGATIRHSLDACLQQCKKEKLFPENAQLVMDAEPLALGIHRLFLTITYESSGPDTPTSNQCIDERFKESINDMGFEIINNDENPAQEESSYINWLNIIINLLATGAIFALALIFPPSLLLTIGLTSISFLTSAFTAREYLRNFFRNPRNLFSMATTVSLGWILSLAHTLYHAITMSVISSFSMVFMCFMMPVLLITIINCMDEIKHQVLKKAKKIHLRGMNMLFPQIADTYPYYELSPKEQQILSRPINDILNEYEDPEEFFTFIEGITKNNKLLRGKKNSLKNGMIINVKHGECFPVDCILLQEHTVVDSSLLTGEPQQAKQRLDFIPAGAINLGAAVTVYTTQDSYNSTINTLLFRSNRAKQNNPEKENNKFTYIYTSLILIGIGISIIAPLVFGAATISILLQNIIGILDAVCPCNIAIAVQLPNLLNLYQRTKKGITIRDENLCQQTHAIHTVVFDKTGTLTTGNSEVESAEGITSSLWERIYLLEKEHGAAHPLAKAITRHYEAQTTHKSIIKDVNNVSRDPLNRGLSAEVQGKTLHLGSAEYLQRSGILVPELNADKIAQGFTPVYVAENNLYKGVIYIKHEIRKDILKALSHLKQEGINLIMITGDNKLSAMRFNEHIESIFAVENIHAEQTPQNKEKFINNLMNSKDIDPKGVWFIGDGLNDAPCAKMVSENGGISCAMTPDDKTSFFADISLNGTLNYMFEHNKLNQFLQKNILQNQGLLIYGTISFIAFIVSFSMVSLAVSPLIPLIIMASTTLMILFNSYRVQLVIDNALDSATSWLKQILASDASIGILTTASMLFMSSLLISTLATGGFAFPTIVFTAGAAAAISSVCLLTAGILCTLFMLVATAYWVTEKTGDFHKEENISASAPEVKSGNDFPTTQPLHHPKEKTSAPYPLWSYSSSERVSTDDTYQSNCSL